jgi:hypothetical protein
VFLKLIPFSLVDIYINASEEATVSIFRVDKDGGSRFLQNFGKYLPD